MMYLFLFFLFCFYGSISSESSSSTNPSGDYLSSIEFAQEFLLFTKDHSSTQCLIKAYETFVPQGCSYLGELDKAVFTVALLSCKMEVLHGEPINCDLQGWLKESQRSTTVTMDDKNNNQLPRSLYKYCNKDGHNTFTTEAWLTMNNHIDNLCYFAESRLWRQQAHQTSLLLLHSSNTSAMTLQLIANESEQLRENTEKALDEATNMRQQVLHTQAELYNLSESTKYTYQTVGSVLERIVHYTEATLWIQSTMMTNYYFLECLGFYGLFSYLLWFITAQPQARRARFTLIMGMIICALLEYYLLSDRIKDRIHIPDTSSDISTSTLLSNIHSKPSVVHIEINETNTPYSTLYSSDNSISNESTLYSIITQISSAFNFFIDWVIFPTLNLMNWIVWLIYTPLMYIFRYLVGKILSALFSGSFANEIEEVLTSTEFHLWTIQQRIWIVRSIYIIYAAIVILYYYFTYVDYSQLNYNLLTELREETRTLLTSVKSEVNKIAAIKANSTPYSASRYGYQDIVEFDENTTNESGWISRWFTRMIPKIFRRRSTNIIPSSSLATPNHRQRHRSSSFSNSAISLLTLPTELMDTNQQPDNEENNSVVLDPDYDPLNPDDIIPPIIGYNNAEEGIEEIMHETEAESDHPVSHDRTITPRIFSDDNDEPFVPLRSKQDYSLRPRDPQNGLAINGLGIGSGYTNPILDYESPESFSLLVGLSQRASALARLLWSRANSFLHDNTITHDLPREGIDSIDTDTWSDSDDNDDSEGEDNTMVNENMVPTTLVYRSRPNYIPTTVETLDSDNESILSQTNSRNNNYRSSTSTLSSRTKTPPVSRNILSNIIDSDGDEDYEPDSNQNNHVKRTTTGRRSTTKSSSKQLSTLSTTLTSPITNVASDSRVGTQGKRTRASSAKRK